MIDGTKPHRGALILVLGIVSLVICQLLGVAPWVMANGDLAEMDAGRMDPEGRGLTQAGKVLGIVSIVLCIIGVVIGVGMLLFAMVIGAAAQ